ncbi:alpha/beta fold hydrolase [Anaerobacillus alkaliphilus]|uniref:alpha/beta fold hydrolase n=1 Tax=Anaerobacillus alkaliphilus TaxID=1548597 RepID=UPI0013760A25|nr:homoserine O-acetyltransferase [Anaerobacillus alkaliphilus]
MYITKQSFTVQEFLFEAGVTMPVTAGYETYGELNEDKSNAILICHYFSGTSHAGGDGYRIGSDQVIQEPGWWSPLIGPGKAFDTEQYFIVCMDVISNVNVKHPNVITTGPATIDPSTGQRYGLSFPQVTIRDFVRLQKLLLETLGINHLVCVAGPSMGGMQALQWAVDYPDDIDHVIAVVSTGRTSTYTSVNPLQLGIEAILANEIAGVYSAIKGMTIQAYSYPYAEQLWGYEAVKPSLRGELQPIHFHQKLDEIVNKRVETVDPYHWLYISRVCQQFTLEKGYDSYEAALSRIKANVLIIPTVSDLIFPASESKDLVDRLHRLGRTAYYHELVSDNGHMEAIINSPSYSEIISDFLGGKL